MKIHKILLHADFLRGIRENNWIKKTKQQQQKKPACVGISHTPTKKGICAAISTNSRTFSSSTEEIPSALAVTPHFPLGPGNHSTTFCFHRFACSEHYRWDHTARAFVAGFFHLESYFQSSPMLFIHVSCFIPLYGWVLVHRMNRLLFVYQFTYWWALGRLLLFRFV